MARFEPDIAEEFIYQRLAANATLVTLVNSRFYNGNQIPQNALWPSVVYTMLSGVDLQWIGTTRIWTNCLYLVEAVDQTQDYADVTPIAIQIDTALQGITGTVTGGVIYKVHREEPSRRSEFTSGLSYRRSGGVYRLRAQAT